MIIFFSGIAVTLNVSDHLRINLCCRIKTKGCLDKVVFEVSIDSLGATYHLNTCANLLVILGKNRCICIGVITTNYHESSDTKLLEYFETFVELFFLLKLSTA